MIEVQNLTKKFGDKIAVNGISFKVKKGEIFGFLGPNGAGKTTTIKMLTGQLLPTDGWCRVSGIDPAKEEKKLAMHIGVVPEVQNLYQDMSAEKNLRFFAGLYGVDKERVGALLKEFELEEHRDKAVKKLSKGLRQRVLIARALLHDPELLFMDEPTVGLDPHIAREIRNMIREFRARGKTIFLTTHYMEEADALCDRVGIIDEGEIVALDAPHDLRLKHGKREVVVETDDGVVKLPITDVRLKSIDPEKIRSIHSAEPTLEDVFISLTGKRWDVDKERADI